jgi:hypothetical protein
MALESDVRRGVFGGAQLDDISNRLSLTYSMVSGARGSPPNRPFCRGTSQPRERRCSPTRNAPAGSLDMVCDRDN